MKPYRGQQLPLHAARVLPRASLGRVCWASLGPFLIAALIGSLLFRASSSSGSAEEVVAQGHPSRVLEETDRAGACVGAGCGQRQAQAASAGGGPAQQGAAAGADATAGAASLLVSAGGSGGSSSSSLSHGSNVSVSGGGLPPVLLFIGILSGRGYRHRRLAVREAWSNRAQIPGQVVARFILSEDERTPQVEKELEAYGDIVFVREKTNYKSILYKTYYVMEYAATHFDAAFILKTDDDAFINVAPLLDQLRALCENPGCARERLYMGKMAKHSEIMLQPGHRWNNAAFHNHTGLKFYPNYMMGGGYVVSGEVARVLVDIHSRMRLKFTPIEDATLGLWLMAMDLRHVDHPRFFTWAAPCCFKAPVRKPGERFVSRFQLEEEFDSGLCSPDPWIILHKIDSPTKMRYVGSRVANCTQPVRPWGLAASLEAHVSAEQRAALMQLWEQRKAERPLEAQQEEERARRPPPAAAQQAASSGSAASGQGASGTAGVAAGAAAGAAGALAGGSSLGEAASGGQGLGDAAVGSVGGDVGSDAAGVGGLGIGAAAGGATQAAGNAANSLSTAVFSHASDSLGAASQAGGGDPRGGALLANEADPGSAANSAAGSQSLQGGGAAAGNAATGDSGAQASGAAANAAGTAQLGASGAAQSQVVSGAGGGGSQQQVYDESPPVPVLGTDGGLVIPRDQAELGIVAGSAVTGEATGTTQAATAASQR